MKQFNTKLKNLVCFFCLLMLFTSCEKDKEDFLIDHRWSTDVSKNSNARIVNLRGVNQIVLNGDTLTSFIVRDRNAADYYKYPGTKYFPEDGKLGSIWTIPLELFDASDKAHIITKTVQWYSHLPDYAVEFTVKTQEQAMDYYLLSSVFVTGMPDMMEVPRGIEAPSKPDHFRIRVLNLAADITSRGSSGMEDLLGPVTLTYADGTPVSPVLSDIAPQTCSDYVEVPYGTYQFRVLTADGRQLPGKPKLDYIIYLNPPTSTMLVYNGVFYSSNLTYAPINSFQPGGIYTVVIQTNEFTYYESATATDALSGIQNAFDFIEDISEPANLTYGRLQFVNALPADGKVKLKINGKTFNETSAEYGAYSDYIRLLTGTYTIETVNEAGETIASETLELKANSNYSVWLYPENETPEIAFAANDLSGASYTGGEQDASFRRLIRPVYQKLRFLNLNANYPYVTFTSNNGQPFYNEASRQLQPGVIPTEEPYLYLSIIADEFNIMAYNSSVSVMPGVWAEEVPALRSSTGLVARRELYTRGFPASEPGVYTIALIGKEPGNTAYPPKMIVVKHTK